MDCGLCDPLSYLFSVSLRRIPSETFLEKCAKSTLFGAAIFQEHSKEREEMKWSKKLHTTRVLFLDYCPPG